MQKSIVLIIRDGWGVNNNPEFNAVKGAHTPNTDALLDKYPHTLLGASGSSVGLPDGYQGSSEVGHLNVGAGRVVVQEMTRIMQQIRDGEFFKSNNFQNAISNVLENNSALHLMGLLQDEGVHAHQDHLFALMKYAKESGVKKVCIHVFTDGRDTSPRSALGYIGNLREKMEEYNIGVIATVMGRYYAMDRGRNWELTGVAYDALTRAQGTRIDNVEDAIRDVYNTTTPNNEEMFDEYVPPMIVGDFKGICDGDSVIHINYRQDRAIQLTKAFVEDDYPGARWKKLDIVYCGFTRYYDEFRYNILGAIDDGGGMENLLGQVLSQKGLRQIRISETQKFSHVTSFFNGKRTEPYKDEEQIEIRGEYDPATFADHPQMNAHDVTKRAVEIINSDDFTLLVINLANCDMVGHTGN
ncbi:MAG: 2,3-bisphosphoglycerate-independent phosphoglycerate mutase [Planctomycetes bacterium]|nr:2,3-bisphosphoglycerate-independent phosphoglycerate mutase [Planctomycetota bacterium]